MLAKIFFFFFLSIFFKIKKRKRKILFNIWFKFFPFCFFGMRFIIFPLFRFLHLQTFHLFVKLSVYFPVFIINGWKNDQRSAQNAKNNTKNDGQIVFLLFAILVKRRGKRNRQRIGLCIKIRIDFVTLTVLVIADNLYLWVGNVQTLRTIVRKQLEGRVSFIGPIVYRIWREPSKDTHSETTRVTFLLVSENTNTRVLFEGWLKFPTNKEVEFNSIELWFSKNNVEFKIL